MKVNDIIVLENDERYTLLEKTTKDEKNYFLAAGIDEQENIDHTNLVLLEVFTEEDGDYVELVDDPELITQLAGKIIDANK